jgi:hypothetical protein
MDKAIRQNIDRRALLKGASIATVAAAIPATIATAIGAPSPALAEAAIVITTPTPDPIFALIAELNRVKALQKAVSARRCRIEAAWPTLAYRGPLMGDALTQRKLDVERSGWDRVADEEDVLGEKWCDAENAALLTPPATRAGVLAKLALLREVHAEAHGDISQDYILSMFDDLERLVAGKGGAA